MKHVILTTIAALMLLSTSTWATVRTVSNLPNSPGQYSGLQEAINISSDGDTILVSGSPTSYGFVTVIRPLTIIGDGYNHPNDYNSTASFEIRSSNVYISGFILDTFMNVRESLQQTIANVTIERCFLRTITGSYSVSFNGLESSINDYAKISNIQFLNNVVDGCSNSFSNIDINLATSSYPKIDMESILFANNVFLATRFYIDDDAINTENIILSHNIFYRRSSSETTTFNSDTRDVVVKDNVFYNVNPLGGNNCTYINNITFGTDNTAPGSNNLGTGNINYTNPLFVDPNANSDCDYTNLNFAFNPGSPAVGAASNGTDMGISGGAYPFDVGDTPRWSEVIEVILQESAVPINGVINVEFEAKGNN